MESPRFDKWPARQAAAPAHAAVPVARARVLHVINGEDYSGAERVQDLLAMQLRRYGYEVGFVCVRPGRFESERHAQDVPLCNLPMHSRLDLRPVRDLARLIRREGYDLVHTHSPRTALVGRPAAACAGVPMVHHLHGQTSADIATRWRGPVNAVVERLCLLRVAAVIVVRETLRSYLRRQAIPARRIRLVPNGVPTREPLPNRDPPRGEWTIGTVAMFRPHKGLDILLQALAIVRSQGFAVRLHAVGCFQTPAYEAEIKAFAGRHGLSDLIDWIGFTRDVNAELARMDLLVQPSRAAEGIPMAMLEAMAAGVPVVGSRVAGITDVIRDQVEGLLTKPGDPMDLAAVLAQLIRGQLDWQGLRQRAHARQSESFSDHSMAAGVASVYDEVLGHMAGASGRGKTVA